MTGDEMIFPDTFDEFVDLYGFIDTKEVYTNGSQLIPVFRVKQWLEHVDSHLIYVQELAYYKGKTDGIKECTARLKKMNEEYTNG